VDSPFPADDICSLVDDSEDCCIFSDDEVVEVLLDSWLPGVADS
jgi:hypothetical protein